MGCIFGRKKKGSEPKSEVLVPLYVYPAPGAWDPLFTVIEKHPSLNFTVIINPDSGPGAAAGPDGNYTRDIPRLNAYANVVTVGYVSTDYTKRDIAMVQQDISTYGAWSDDKNISIGMQGIFLDETPSQYEAESMQYYERIASTIRSTSGLGTNPLIIHNPGVVPDNRYLAVCDLSVVFEGTYESYHIYNSSKGISELAKSTKSARGREGLASIVHGVPANLSKKDHKSFLKQLRSSSGSLFITDLSTDYYSSFGGGWQGFVESLAS